MSREVAEKAVGAPGVIDRAGFHPEIEGLRAIAILLVVVFHARLGALFGGYIGVDVFFVLSGYLITGIIVREIEKKGSLSLPAFYARRARRLLPAMFLTVLVTIIVGAVIYPPVEVNSGGYAATTISTAVYASNLYFAKVGTEYFDADHDLNPLLHTWSLSVEEQFYLVWPIFVMFGMGVIPWRRRKELSRRRLLWWMIAAAGLSFVLSAYLTYVRQPWAYFTSPSRTWEFAVGAIAVLLPRERAFSWLLNRPSSFNAAVSPVSGWMSKVSDWSGWIGLGGIFASALVFGPTTTFPGFAALLPTLSTAIALRATTNPNNELMVRALSIAPLQRIGALSYSWYLWHWPVLVMGTAVIVTPSVAARLGLVVLSFLISIVSYRFFENPIRHSATLSRRHRYSLAMAAALAIIGVSVSLLWRQLSFREAERPAQARFVRAKFEGAGPLGQRGCALGLLDVDIKDCVFGTEGSPVPVVLYGDSHARQWFSALEPIALKRNWRLETLLKMGCAPVDAPFFEERLGRIYTECEDWRKKATQKIRQMRPMLTVLAFSELYPFQDTEWRNGLSSVVEDLAASSQHVIILRDNPQATFDIPTCIARRSWRPAFLPSAQCEFPFPPTSRVYDLENLLAQQLHNVTVTDLTSGICHEGICTGERGDLVIYSDSNHLTLGFVKGLEPQFAQEIDRALARHNARQGS